MCMVCPIAAKAYAYGESIESSNSSDLGMMNCRPTCGSRRGTPRGPWLVSISHTTSASFRRRDQSCCTSSKASSSSGVQVVRAKGTNVPRHLRVSRISPPSHLPWRRAALTRLVLQAESLKASFSMAQLPAMATGMHITYSLLHSFLSYQPS